MEEAAERRRRRRHLYAAAVLAQLLSFLIAMTGVTSEKLAISRHLAAPTFQAFLNYCLLAVTFGAWLLYWRVPLKQAWYKYAALSLLDVEANYLVTKAYQFTSITSVTLLDCCTIPAAMGFSILLLRARYRRGHYGGAAMCLAGVALLLLTEQRSASGGSNPWLGDLLVMAGSLVYALCNVTQVKTFISSINHLVKITQNECGRTGAAVFNCIAA